MTFATYVDLESWSGRTFANHAHADYLLSVASAKVVDEAGWHIAPVVTETVRLTGQGGRLLVLPTKQVVDITEVRWEDRRFVDPVVVDSDAYTWSVDGLLELDAGFAWPDTLDALTVDLVHGYAAVPEPIIDVVCRLALPGLSQPIGYIPGMTSQMSTGSVSMSFRNDADNVGEFTDVMRHRIRKYVL